ncbi:MAG TPA: M48 family metallopeptidase [Pyrinomonadaceae bacterium]
MAKLTLVLLLLTAPVITFGQSRPIVDSQQKITAYTLPPDRYQQAHELNRTVFVFRLVSIVYTIIVLLFVLYARLAVKIRDLAERVSGKRFLQALIFGPLLVLLLVLFQLPADTYIHRVSMQYGLSVQGWPSWFLDWTKQQLLSVVAVTLFIWLLYAIIRKSPKRWWLYFWLASLPIVLFIVFIQPFVIDPLFDRFEPLAKKDPALATSLNQMAQRAGEDIPVDRMFRMNASEKTTTLNAYVTGLGASKRIVVWDTTMAKLTTPQIVFVAGHEMGHYVLHHVSKGLVLAAFGTLILFYSGYRISVWFLAKSSGRWSIRGIDDYASLPFMLLIVSLLLLISTPVESGVSRYFEHQADQYALEITHGLTADSGQVGAQSFQALGYVGLSDPDPNPVNVFLFYDHPTISDRVKFCLTYDPWANGKSPEF